MLIVLTIIGWFLLVNQNQTNKIMLNEKQILITEQTKKENLIDSKGYKIENPKVIIYPYDISPLTALVIFEAKDEVMPKVTIEGKDRQTTITHTFQKKTITIKTKQFPKDFILPASVKADKTKL